MRLPMPAPRHVPWRLKPVDSAVTGVSYDRHGRMVLSIEHDIIRGVTPDEIAWWFANIAGDVEIEGRRVDRYLAWHPADHIRWELAREAPSGGAAAGARFRIVEAFGARPEYYIDVTETVTRLDSSGLTLVNCKLGLEVSRLNHDFIAVDGGTRYLSTLTIGIGVPVLGPLLNPLLHRLVFDEAKGRAWLKHNVEEVGAFEHVLPLLLRQLGMAPASPAATPAASREGRGEALRRAVRAGVATARPS